MYRIDPNTGRKTPDTPIKLKGPLPGEGAEKGSNINAPVIANDGENKRQIILLEKLAEGGEGSVFSTNVLNHVAKIYHRDKLTANLEKKVRALLPLIPRYAYPLPCSITASRSSSAFLCPGQRVSSWENLFFNLSCS